MYIQTTECLLSESVKFMCIPLETMSRKENKKLSCNHVIFSTDKGVK
jgi:hypothetical protein